MSGRRRPRRPKTGRRTALLLLSALLPAAGCAQSAPPQPTDPTPPFAACADLSTPPATSADAGAAPDPDRASVSLPDMELPCFTGGEPIQLRAVRGPAVINLWATWCHPCRKELPVFQRAATRLAGRVHVIGVNVRDDRGKAQALAEDFGLTFPNLFDPDDELRRELGRPVLPITLFVDGAGQVRHVEASGALDDAELAERIEQHLGLVVP
ncbi:MAG TPA: TlpA disulfide reductase family protein [Micromonosporaceae bacterium]